MLHLLCQIIKIKTLNIYIYNIRKKNCKFSFQYSLTSLYSDFKYKLQLNTILFINSSEKYNAESTSNNNDACTGHII